MTDDFNKDKRAIDKLRQLNDSLYSRTRYTDPNLNRSTIGVGDEPEVNKSWQSKNIDEIIAGDKHKIETHPVIKKIFIISILFFVIMLGFSAYVFFGGGNFISSKNVDITILGPVSVSAGDTLNMNVYIKNSNNADLTNVNMLIEYPDSTRNADEANSPLVRTTVPVGTIASGADYNYVAKAVLFGQKADTKEIKVSIDYGVKGSNATFTKEKIYDVTIGTSPVIMTVAQTDSVSSGDSFSTTITVASNSSEVIKSVLVRGEYPYGFSMTDSVPSSVRSKNIWVLGDIAPGEKKVIKINGILTGEDKEERTFRFYTGVASATDDQQFDAALAFSSNTVSINHSSLGLNLSFNDNNDSSYVAPAGSSIQGKIAYKNNLPQNALNGVIKLKITGSTLDKFTIVPQNGGFYNSSTNTITWDKSSTPELGSIAPGASGEVSYRFASIQNTINAGKNSEILMSGSFNAVPQNNDSTLKLSASQSGSVKIASEVSLNARGLYSRGPFSNSGPLPPKAENATTYTVVLTLGNTQNDISGATVVGTLGSNVTWTGDVSPSSENVTYDQNTNSVTWHVDNLVSGAGFSAPGRQAFFKVSLTPSLGQVGSVPILLQNVGFTGADNFTTNTVRVSFGQVTTRTDTDPNYVQGNEIVVK